MSANADKSKTPIRPGDDFIPANNDRELVLNKRGQKYVFRCAPGQEADLINQLVEQAKDPSSDIDWFDAAVLSHQMGQKFNKQITEILKS